MLTSAPKHLAYVGPFDRICHGLGTNPATTDSKEAAPSLPDLAKAVRYLYITPNVYVSAASVGQGHGTAQGEDPPVLCRAPAPRWPR